MNKAMAVLLWVVSATSQAAIVGTAEMQNGASIVFHDERGPCIGTARLATFTSAQGDAVPGCWVNRAHHIAVVFFDGDVGAVPVAALKPPKTV